MTTPAGITHEQFCHEVRVAQQPFGAGPLPLHRREVASQHPSARGCGRFGDLSDFCEGRGPRRTDRLHGKSSLQ